MDLYQFMQSCKILNKIVTKKDVERCIVCEIERRLHDICKDDYTEFMEMLKITNAKIIRQFITECIIGETWKGCIIIYIPESVDTEKFINFVKEKNYKTKQLFYERYDANEKNVSIPSMRCYFNHGVIDIMLPIYQQRNKFTEKYVHTYTQCNIYKNIYTVASIELYIHRINEIFAKNTNFPKKRRSATAFRKAHKRGFQFYKSKIDKQIMSNNDIICAYYNVAKIRCRYTLEWCEKN
uniref:Uncharacterized protein n=1 Tax=viral metagenome TaxID=1070528 RepID=A0A6C0CAB5_9ZZZZ